MNANHIIIKQVALWAAVLMLAGCAEPIVDTSGLELRSEEAFDELQSSRSTMQQQLEVAQQSLARKQLEDAQLQSRLREVQAAQLEQRAQRDQAERNLKDTEAALARQESVTARVERSAALWRMWAAFLLVLAVLLPFVGAAAGSATRKEVLRGRS